MYQERLGAAGYTIFQLARTNGRVDELMLLGFILLLLMVSQGLLSKLCVREGVLMHMLPCSHEARREAEEAAGEYGDKNVTAKEHFQTFLPIVGATRRLLAEHDATATGYCSLKGKVPLLSLEAFHHLHIFIFVLAISHVTFCVLTVVFGSTRIHQWKKWEDSIADESYDPEAAFCDILKQSQQDVLLHDASYHRAVQLEGPEASLLSILNMLLESSPSSYSKEVLDSVLAGLSYKSAMV